tara:strand:+ start:156 stop:467 length:312 start_codon:yes stop_codon:yes gene_type:complete
MPITLENIRLLIPIAQLIFSAVFLVAGLRKLLAKEFTPAARALASQSARIGQKGLRQNVSSISQTASALLNSVNQLVRTSAGVGAFLVLVGLFFMVSAYWIVK